MGAEQQRNRAVSQTCSWRIAKSGRNEARICQSEPGNRGTGQSPKLAPGGLPNPAEMRLGFANPNRATGEAGGLSDINGSDAKHGNEIRR